jgi:hypothetical protein
MSLFSVFFVLWSQFLLYKKPILLHGIGAVWQNIPPVILSQHFADITVLGAMYQIGILPVLYGVFLIFKYLFREQRAPMYLFIAFVAASVLLLWFRLIPVVLGLQLLGLILVILFAYWYTFFIAELKRTRFHRFLPLFILGFFIAFVASSVIPSVLVARAVQEQSLSPAGLSVLDWIRARTPEGGVIAAPLGQGHLITALAQRKNVIDSHFLLQEDAKQRLVDVQRLFKTSLELEAIEILDRYQATAVLIPPSHAGALAFARASGCFGTAYEGHGYLFVVKHPYCKVEVVA